jgi:hypothetical protein
MAKLSRETLKEIVKECLVEILAEGISGGNTKSLTESINAAETNYSVAKSKNINRMLPPRQDKEAINKRFEENISNSIAKTTKDPIMAELLADTARTTLQEQNVADQPNKFIAKGHDTASTIVEQHNPEDLFGGEAANNWAKLAFFDGK